MLQVRHLNFRMLLVGLLVLLSAASAFAQTSAIAGTVTDSAGAVVNGAQVSVKNVGTGEVHTVTTSGTGTYTITPLSVGVYEITVTKDGFKTFRVPDARLTVGQTMGVNVKLEPGVVTEEIQVKADQLPDVDLEDAQVSNLVDSRQMKDLPLITRNPYELILLSPGTNQTNSRLGGISVNGSRERNNNFLLDGVDNNDASVPGGLGGVVGSDPESTQEFRVITDTFNAEYGRNTGAIVDVVTKSGTNAFHGDAYEFGRWNGFGGARDWFNTVGNPQDPYIRHQFGYSIGGPIIKNKTFFFFNQEFDRFITALSSSAVVPTAAFKTGKFNYTFTTQALGTQTVPVDLTATGANNVYGYLGLDVDPTTKKIFAQYPTPSSSVDGMTGLVFFPGTSRQKAYQATAKIDHHLTDKHFISLRYAYDPVSDPNPFHDDLLPGNVGSTALKAIGQGVAANLTSTFNSALVNSFSFGWNHSNPGFACTGLSTLDQVSQQEGTLDRFGFGRDYHFSPFTGFGCLSLDSNSQFRVAGTTSYTDSVSWVHGRHTFKFGGDFRNVVEGGADSFFSRRQVFTNLDSLGFGVTGLVAGIPQDINDANPQIQIDNAAFALWGLVGEDLQGEFFTKNGTRQGINIAHFRQHEYDGFGQDTWKLRSNLTLSLGLRYQFDGVPYEENANFSNLLANPGSLPAGSPAVFSTVGPGTGKQLFNNDYSNFEPRIGLSWDPWGDGKTAIRAGFAIFHDRVFGNLFTNAKGNPPFELDRETFPGETLHDVFGSGAFPAIAPDTVPTATIADGKHVATAVIFDVHFRNPVSNNWNFGIQRELANNLTLDLTYQGSQSHHVFRVLDGNPPDPALVAALLQFCSTLSTQKAINTCDNNVTFTNLYEGKQRGALPFNAVVNNALEQPVFNTSSGDANFNALEAKITRRFSHGLQVQGSYTWSHSNDNANDPIDAAQGNRNFPRNSRNSRSEYGNSDNDVRHTAVINYVYELPMGKGKGYLNTGALGRILQGMQLSGITTLQTGHPFDIFSTTDSQRTGLSQRADLVGNPFAPGSNDVNAPANGTKAWFRNPQAFAQPLLPGNLVPIPGRPGTTGRNQFYGPGFVNFDMVWAKKMTFGERVGAELRAECYNIFNHPHFLNPTNGITSSFFGQITGTASRGDGTTSARQMQVALKVTF